MVLMNNVIGLAESIRTSTSDKLHNNISLSRMHNSLVDLFLDRTAINKSVNLFDNSDGVKKTLRYIHCKDLNDERTIKFHQSWKQKDDVFDEKRQIWISRFIDTINDDLFIPRDDAQ